MKKYSLKYHLLNENPTLDVGNIEDQTETFPFRLDLGEFAKINSNLTPDSFNDLLYLVSLQDPDLFKDILIKNINVQSSSQVLDNIRSESQHLKDSIESLEESFDSLILHIIEEKTDQEIPSSTQDQSLYNVYPGLYMGRVAANDNVEAPKQASLKTAGYIRNTSGKNNLFENTSQLTSKEARAIQSIIASNRLSEEDANRLIDIILGIKDYINEIKVIAKSEDIDIETSIASLMALSGRKKINLINLFQSIPTADDLKKTVSNVVNSSNRQDFKQNMQICIYQSCGLHKPDYVFAKMDSLLNIARQAKDRIAQIQSDESIKDAEKKDLVQDVLTNLNAVATRIVRLNEAIKRYKDVTGINFKQMSTDANLKDFFTRQGTKIGYLLEDIIGSIYNGTTGNGEGVVDPRLNSLSGEESNPIKTKPYALAMCAVITNKLDEIAGGKNKIINSSNYATCLSRFIKDHIKVEGKAKVTENFKVNIEKILELENSYMHSVDNILSADNDGEVKNSGFDFLISSTVDTPKLESEVIVFDLKSSHVQSSKVKTSRTPTGSNLKNHATNELITLSNVKDASIVDLENKLSNEAHDKVDLDKQKGYNIKCVSLVKVKWSIEDKFNIEKIESSMTSLYKATIGSAKEPQLNFHVDDSESVLNNFDLFEEIDSTTLENFINYINNPDLNPNIIVKDKRVDSDSFNLLVKDFKDYKDVNKESHFNFIEGKLLMNNRPRTKAEYIIFNSIYNFYVSNTIDTLRVHEDHEDFESIQEFFSDANKIESIKENLFIASSLRVEDAVKNTNLEELEKHNKLKKEWEDSDQESRGPRPRLRGDNAKGTLIRLFLPKNLEKDNRSERVEFSEPEKYEYAIADLDNKEMFGGTGRQGTISTTSLFKYLKQVFPNEFSFKKSKIHKNLDDSYNRKGKLLREVYSHLFRK